MKTLTQLANDIDEVMTPFDNAWKQAQLEWFLAGKKAVKAFRDSEEYQALRKNPWALYEKLYSLAGGKGNYESDAASFSKKCDRTIIARNTKIAQKIMSAGDKDTTVESGEILRTNDGFHGLFKLNTNSGSKTIKIETIGAGGYNIQAYHLRTLVQVR